MIKTKEKAKEEKSKNPKEEKKKERKKERSVTTAVFTAATLIYYRCCRVPSAIRLNYVPCNIGAARDDKY